MSRFGSLEFEDQPQPSADAQAGARADGTGTPVRDAAHFRGVAEAALRGGHYDAALRNYSRALEQDSTAFPCWLGQVRALIELDEMDEAVLWADKALEMFPEHPELLAAKAVASARMGLLGKAMAYSDNAVAATGNTPYVWLSRGEVLMLRRSPMADHCLSQALGACAERRERAWLRVDLARLMGSYRRHAEALSYASEAVQDLPRQAMAWLELGLCQEALGMKEAIASLSGAVRLDKTCGAAQQALARVERDGPPSWLRRFLRRLFRR